MVMVVMMMMMMVMMLVAIPPILRGLKSGRSRAVRIVGCQQLTGAGHRLQQVRISRGGGEWIGHRGGGQGDASQDRRKRDAGKQDRS